ncbi:hypothetical protein [Natronosalvus vescus]|uniref:hypothetical protein n=1 Tax=Natronosalvus vescus TaxID=2953881 RepID=UPI0020902B1D|nr:hypothetical protein [Natronosalvus vescus]
MDTLGGCFERDRRSERPVLEDGTGRTFDAHWLRTSAWKAGNFLRHTGVRRGVTVGISGSGPLALLALFGTGLLEGTVRFDPPRDGRSIDGLRTVVAPVDELDTYDLPPGAQRVGYGGKPTNPAVHHFDAGLWSENPSFPPLEIDPETPLLTNGTRTYDHGTVLAAAREVVEDWGLETGDRVVVEAPLSDPRTVVAGVVAPLLVDAITVLPGTETKYEGAEILIDRASTERHGATAGRRRPVSSVELE